MRAKFINESLTPKEKRDEVSRILSSMDMEELPPGSFVKFHDLSLTDLTPEEIVEILLKESVNFERGQDPKSSMNIGERGSIERTFKDIINQEELTGIAYIGPKEDPLNEDYPMLLVRGPGSGLKSGIRRIFKEHGFDKYLDLHPFIMRLDDTYLYYPIKPEYEDLFRGMNLHWRSLDESINFERGQDPKSAMGLGEWSKGYKVEFNPYEGRKNPPPNDAINFKAYDWAKNPGAPEVVDGFTTVTKNIYHQLDKLPLVVFKGWDNMVIGGQQYLGLFGDWAEDRSENFEFFDTPFVARVEDDEEDRNYLVDPEGFNYARYVTELV